MLRTLIALAYLIVGLVVANSHGYFHVHDLKGVISAVIAVLLWPLILLGVNLHIGTLAHSGKSHK